MACQMACLEITVWCRDKGMIWKAILLVRMFSSCLAHRWTHVLSCMSCGVHGEFHFQWWTIETIVHHWELGMVPLSHKTPWQVRYTKIAVCQSVKIHVQKLLHSPSRGTTRSTTMYTSCKLIETSRHGVAWLPCCFVRTICPAAILLHTN